MIIFVKDFLKALLIVLSYDFLYMYLDGVKYQHSADQHHGISTSQHRHLSRPAAATREKMTRFG